FAHDLHAYVCGPVEPPHAPARAQQASAHETHR
ncbi:MAG TPA: MotA/TolQ/ExbB proton channel family protein, partial [Paraburkholderia sp.]